MKSEDAFETLVDAGRTQAGDLGYKPKEGKSLFRPTDIAVAPSGALYVAGWGLTHGSVYASFGGADSRAKKNYGRVFRIFHKERPLHKKKDWLTAKRSKPHSRWTFQELLDDLGAQIRHGGSMHRKNSFSEAPSMFQRLSRRFKVANYQKVRKLGQHGP